MFMPQRNGIKIKCEPAYIHDTTDVSLKTNYLNQKEYSWAFIPFKNYTVIRWSDNAPPAKQRYTATSWSFTM